MKDMRFINSIEIDKYFGKHQGFIDRIYAKYGFSPEHYLGYVPLFFLPSLNHQKNGIKNMHYHLHQRIILQRIIYQKQLLWKAAVSPLTPPIINGFNVKNSIDNAAAVQKAVTIFDSHFDQWVSRGYSAFILKRVIQDFKRQLWLNNTTHNNGSDQSVSTILKYDYQFNVVEQYPVQLNQSNSVKDQFTNIMALYGKCYQIIEQSHKLYKSKSHFLNKPFLPRILNSDISLLKILYEAPYGKGLSLQGNRRLYTGSEIVYIESAQISSYQIAKIMAVLGGWLQAGDKHSLQSCELPYERNLSSQLHDIKQYQEIFHYYSGFKKIISNTREEKSSRYQETYQLLRAAKPAERVQYLEFIKHFNNLVLSQKHFNTDSAGWQRLYTLEHHPESDVKGKRSSFTSIENVYFKNSQFAGEQIARLVSIIDSFAPRRAEKQRSLPTYVYDRHHPVRRYIIPINEMKQYQEIFHYYSGFKKIISNTREEKSSRYQETYQLLRAAKPAERVQYLEFIKHFNNLVLSQKHFNTDSAGYQHFSISPVTTIPVAEISTYNSISNSWGLNRNRISSNAETTRQFYQLNGLSHSRLSEIKSKESAREVFLQGIYNRQIHNQYLKAEPVDYITPGSIMANYHKMFTSNDKKALTFRYSQYASKLEYRTPANDVYKEQFENQINGLSMEFKRENRVKRDDHTNEPASSETLKMQGDTQKATARLSNEQLDNIVASLYKKLEKKIKFERQRSGIR